MIKTKIKKSITPRFQENTSEKGFALVVTIILSAVMLIVMTLATKEIVDESRNSVRLDNSLIAYYAAEAGIENALLSFRNDHDTKITAECKNVENYATDIVCSTLDKTVNDNPNGYYYRMSMVPQKNSTNKIKIYKDQVHEIPISEETTGQYPILYSQQNYASPDNFQVEITAYLEDGTLLDKKLEMPSIHSGTTKQYLVSLGDNTDKKKIIRVRAWYTNGNGTEGAIPNNSNPPYVELTLPAFLQGYNPSITQIDSVGYYGKVARKISMTLDKSSGNVLGVFDYVIYSDSKLEKK